MKTIDNVLLQLNRFMPNAHSSHSSTIRQPLSYVPLPNQNHVMMTPYNFYSHDLHFVRSVCHLTTISLVYNIVLWLVQFPFRGGCGRILVTPGPEPAEKSTLRGDGSAEAGWRLLRAMRPSLRSHWRLEAASTTTSLFLYGLRYYFTLGNFPFRLVRDWKRYILAHIKVSRFLSMISGLQLDQTLRKSVLSDFFAKLIKSLLSKSG